jgi:hypothetical protein
MTKPRVYKQSDKEAISRRLKHRPPYIWILSEHGPAKILEPWGIWNGPILVGVNGRMVVEPRYHGRIRNY